MLNRILGRKPHGRLSEPAMEQALHELAHRLPSLRSAAFVSTDGLMQKMYNPSGQEPDRVAAMAAAGLSLGDRISGELQNGRLAYSAIAGDEGLFATHVIGDGYVLAVNLPADTEIGLATDVLAQVAASLESTLQADMM